MFFVVDFFQTKKKIFLDKMKNSGDAFSAFLVKPISKKLKKSVFLIIFLNKISFPKKTTERKIETNKQKNASQISNIIN